MSKDCAKSDMGPSCRNKNAEAIFVHIVGISLCLLPVVGYLLPRSLSFVPGLIGLLSFGVGWYLFKCRPSFPKIPVIFVISTIAAALLSCLWSIEQSESLEKTMKVSLVLLPGLLLLAVAKTYGRKLAPVCTAYLPVFTVFALSLALIDLMSHGALYSVPRGLPYDFGFNESNLNRGVIVLSLVIIPAFFAIGLDGKIWHGPRARIYIILSLLLLAGIFWRTDSQSAHLIFALSVFVWALLPVARSWPWHGVWFALSALLLVSPWLAQYMFVTLPDLIGEYDWFEQSYALDRLEIWDFVGRYVENSPVYGHGIQAARYITDFDTQQLYHRETTIFHPHNFALQIWLEFGAIGAVLMVVMFGALLHQLKQGSVKNTRLGLTVFLATLCPAATAYGLWQGWLLGMFIMMAGFCYILYAHDRGADTES